MQYGGEEAVESLDHDILSTIATPAPAGDHGADIEVKHGITMRRVVQPCLEHILSVQRDENKYSSSLFVSCGMTLLASFDRSSASSRSRFGRSR